MENQFELINKLRLNWKINKVGECGCNCEDNGVDNWCEKCQVIVDTLIVTNALGIKENLDTASIFDETRALEVITYLLKEIKKGKNNDNL